MCAYSQLLDYIALHSKRWRMIIKTLYYPLEPICIESSQQSKTCGTQPSRNTCQILKIPTVAQYSRIYPHLGYPSITSYTIMTSLQSMSFFATVIRFIWKAHWQQFFEQTPVVDEIVINQIQKELLKLSAYNSLC
ncbi:hypothetical protein RO3G_07807 [Rhizopus delemar RA 99-880]|uniref:Uncharacterized protein n=1 Tax=Rhizopus delemar (strain RA 99-880 / ATCC MYA-4621 / FGSC 9543 / NRRL 43880) TaxID=246409 RepID=I1C3S2_RHIO9|nr:hypothetical protein RO3G_07807 [Rhizopus delemar RA 99-880]|eukprot:EIE83102.1 hypothetical protein RO3G_07807 [Rhizopus delemar RA 99-880]